MSHARPVFANDAVDSQGWYVACRANELRAGKLLSVPMLHRRLVLFRSRDGSPRALDALCPHLGADLALGRLDGDGIVCAFHGWRIRADGCSAHGRSTRSYPTAERWGLIWVFNGPEVSFGLPDLPPWRHRLLPVQTIRCHPHVVIANGLDVHHVDALHGLELVRPPELEETSPSTLAVTVHARPRSALTRLLTGTTRRDIVARFAVYGPSLAWGSFESPQRFDVLFTGRGGAEPNVCHTQTVVVSDSWTPAAVTRMSAVLMALLLADRRILERLQFRPAFSPDDVVLSRWADRVDSLPIW